MTHSCMMHAVMSHVCDMTHSHILFRHDLFISDMTQSCMMQALSRVETYCKFVARIAWSDGSATWRNPSSKWPWASCNRALQILLCKGELQENKSLSRLPSTLACVKCACTTHLTLTAPSSISGWRWLRLLRAFLFMFTDGNVFYSFREMCETALSSVLGTHYSANSLC